MLVKELAAASGVKKQTIDSYLRENGYIPSAEAAVKIAQVLGVSVEYLITGQETYRREPQAQGTLKPDIRALVRAAEQLDETGRQIVLNLANSLQTWSGQK